MRRPLVFVYGFISYLVFLGSFLYAVAFVGGLVVPKSIDSGSTDRPLVAVAIDLALLSVFALQHSIMARPTFKRWWTRVIPPSIERSTYVLASSVALIVLFWQWRPLPESVWWIAQPLARAFLWCLFCLGWTIVLVSTFSIDHFDLFGLRQVYLFATGRPYVPLGFQAPWLYRYVRHPIMVGFVIAFWATPTMTRGHLLFAAVTTLYILAAIQLEERDLLAYYGRDYADYRKQVGMLLPISKLRRRQ
jgi:protein-S-isoprenylcysteine O-methyltransferase Ste14